MNSRRRSTSLFAFLLILGFGLILSTPSVLGAPLFSEEETLPTLSINDASVSEGDSGTTALNFTVRLSEPAPEGEVRFSIATHDRPNTLEHATSGVDYIAHSAADVVFPAGETVYIFTVLIIGDTEFERDESFFVTLSNPVNATIPVGTSTAVGRILNDDEPPSPSYVVTTSNDSGLGSLRAAIEYANQTTESVFITFADGVNEIKLQSTLTIADYSNVTIYGRSIIGVTVWRWGGFNYPVFSVGSHSNVTMFGLTISNGQGPTGGGIVVGEDASLSLNLTTVAGNRMQWGGTGGGGIYVGPNAELSLNQSAVMNNFADGASGGGILVANGGQLSVENSLIQNNRASSGGGVYLSAGANATINGSRILANRSYPGGSIHIESAAVSVTNSLLEGNTGSSALWLTGGYAQVVNTTVAQTTGSDDGALRVTGGELSVINSTVVANRAGVRVVAPGSLALYNSILAYSSLSDCESIGSLVVRYSLVSDGTCILAGIDGNMWLNPRLSGSDDGYAPGPASPAINAGLDALFPGDVTTATDRAGNPRRQGSAIDMGAIEQAFGIIVPEGPPSLTLHAGPRNVYEGRTTTVRISRTGTTVGNLPVPLRITNLGVSTDDYTLTGGSITGQTGDVTVTIPAGQSSVILILAVVDDDLPEEDESLSFEVLPLTGYELGDSTTATFTIPRNGLPVTISIGDASIQENYEEAPSGVLEFTVELSHPAPAGGVTFDIATEDNTALAGEDYEAKALTGWVIPEGATEFTFNVVVMFDDIQYEADETFFVNLTNVVGATVVREQAVGTILTDSDPIVFTIWIRVTDGDVETYTEIEEGDSGATAVSFTVGLSAPAPANRIVFSLRTEDDTAIAGEDYVAFTAEDVVFPTAFNEYTFIVLIKGDTDFEPDETFFVELYDVWIYGLPVEDTVHSIYYDRVEVVILNDDEEDTTRPVVTITGPVDPGESTTTLPIPITVSFSEPVQPFTAGEVTVTGGVITPGSFAAHASEPNTWAFTVEPTTSNALEVSVAENAVQDAAGNGNTAADYEINFIPSVRVSAIDPIGDVTEGTDVTFTITRNGSLTGALSGDLSVTGATGDILVLSLYTIPAGYASVDVTIDTTDNDTADGTRTVGVALVGVPGALELGIPASISVNVLDNDDDAPPLPVLSINDAVGVEGNSGTTIFRFTVSLSAPAPEGGVTFDIATADDTATAADGDYVAQSLTAQTIAQGQSTYIFSVTVNSDIDYEADETFFVNVTNALGTTVVQGQGVGTIINDDEPPLTISIGDASVEEGDFDTVELNFTVLLSAPAPEGGVTFDIATEDSTATAGEDYEEKAESGVVIPAGEIEYTFNVTVNGDTDYEPNETFYVNVTNALGTTVVQGQGVGTIINDDDAPPLTISIGDTVGVEGNSGTTNFLFTVSLSAPAPEGGVTFDIVTADDTATAADGDYVARSLTAQTIAQGQSTYIFSVTVNGDTDYEPNETFFVNVTNALGATILDGQAVGTIANDDVTEPMDPTPDPTVAPTATPPPTLAPTYPPPPPVSTCTGLNFDPGSPVRASFPDSIAHSVGCRVMYQDGSPVTWHGSDLYNAGVIGHQGVLDLGVINAIDVTSPQGVNQFPDGAVVCLRGAGTLIFLAASGVPRTPVVMTQYTVAEWPGYTCTTLYETGTLVLVARQPE